MKLRGFGRDDVFRAVLLQMEYLVIQAKRGFPSGMTNKESYT
jgi:hypothetical protein